MVMLSFLILVFSITSGWMAGSVYYSSFVLLWNLELVSAQEVRRKMDRSVEFFFSIFL